MSHHMVARNERQHYNYFAQGMLVAVSQAGNVHLAVYPCTQMQPPILSFHTYRSSVVANSYFRFWNVAFVTNAAMYLRTGLQY